VNRDEAKEILMPYRQDTIDVGDPQVAEALAFAKSDPELGRWLEEHCSRQDILRGKFGQIPVPDGLMQQIISEHAAAKRAGFFKKNRALVALAGAMVVLLAAFFYWQQQPREDATLADYQSQMSLMMSTGYGMDLATNDDSSIRNFLRQKNAPSDFVLTGPLKQATLTGCAVETWQDKKVSLVCFHTGSTGDAASSDTWLFVVKRKVVRDAPDGDTPQISHVNRLTLATWTVGDKLYLLGRVGNEADVKKYL